MKLRPLIVTQLAAASQVYAKSCTVHSSNRTTDDSPAILQALAECAHDSVITFSEGVDYNVFNPVIANNLSNVTIQMQGNLHMPQNVTYIQSLVNASASKNASALYWIDLNGPGINWMGSTNVTTGWIECYGQAWWDLNPKNGTGTAARPHLMNYNTTNGTMHNMKIHQMIAWGIAVSGTNITISNTFIDVYSNSSAFPFNTDGFDVKGNHISILDSTIFNGDDAIAVQSGSRNILFRGGTVGYQSHGMSIGSLGQNQASYADVQNITFDDITVIDAVYAARFKSWIGGQGLAKNVTWKNIRAFNVSFPIYITQSYFNQGSAQTQIEPGSTTVRPNNSSVVMENFRWMNFTGTINSYRPGDGSCVTDPCWYNVGLPNLHHNEAIILECNTNSSCSDFVFENIQLVPQNNLKPSVICLNATSELNPHLGLDVVHGMCVNSTYVPK